MDFRHIRAFIAVADALSVTKAAERLHISQPPLTRHLHQLERELGVTLFVRHRHGVALTDAGRRLLEKARMLDAAAADFTTSARRVACGDALPLRVGIAWGLWDAVNRIRVEFAKAAPRVPIEATDAPCWYDSDEKLKARHLDVALARPPFDPSFEVSAPIFHERIQAIVSDDSPLAQLPQLSIRDLATEPLLVWERWHAPVLHDRIFDLYERAGLSPRTIPTPGAGPWNHAGMMLVASGNGIYLGYGVPRTGPHPASGVAVRPVSDPDAVIEVCVVRRRGEPSPAVATFLSCVSRVFPEEPRAARRSVERVSAAVYAARAARRN
jgi:DNA-binding transcriptional LysR family regulator